MSEIIQAQSLGTEVLNLNSNVKEDLEICEQKIREGIKSFLEIGHALKDIQEKKLYRLKYNTFEMYCEKVWELSKTRAYQLIAQCNTMLSLSTIVDEIDLENITESQIRPLAKFDPEVQKEIWQSVLDETQGKKIKPTAKLVEQKAKDYIEVKKNKSEDQEKIETTKQQNSNYEKIEIKPKVAETEKIYIPAQESKVIEIPVKLSGPKLFIENIFVNAALKTLNLSKADFAIQDLKTSAFIPAKNQDNNSVDLNGKGIANLLSDDNFVEYIQSLFDRSKSGDVAELIIFCKVEFNSVWFRLLTGYSDVFCALRSNQPYPVSAFYIGDSPQGFAYNFNGLGRLLTTYPIREVN